ncbi:MAG: DUF1460 domain-containing protein [Bdellovibrionales bacterium]|nr:DUF1460 domain-containing protein [Bdellovibrionales bacterium]
MRAFSGFLILFAAPLAAPAQAAEFKLAGHGASKYGSTLAERLDRISALFVGKPYVDEPLGEGPEGEFDQDPRFRFDAFDCTTYVETVLALALADSPAAFEREIDRIRYVGGKAAFESRRHFPDADWRPGLLELGLARDVTVQVAAGARAGVAKARIHRERWYETLAPDRVKIPGLAPEAARALLARLRARGRDLKPIQSSIPYLPFDVLFQETGTGYSAPRDLLDRIPSGSIFSVVRTRFTASDKVGTQLSVWHQGFVFRRGGNLVVRHATPLGGRRVVEVPAVDFFLAEELRKVNVGSRDHGLNFLMPQAPAAP